MIKLRLLAAIAAVLVVAAACSSGEEPVDALVDLIDSTEPTPIVFDPSDPPTLAGVSTDPSLIDSGDCFNEYIFRDATEFLQQVTTIVSCGGPHDREAYFRTEFPAGAEAGFPLDDELERWADNACLDEFEDFVGLEYVLSTLEIGAIVPTFESWGEGDRAVICYVFPDEGGRLLAPMRNSEI